MTVLVICAGNTEAEINYAKKLIESEQWERFFVVSEKKNELGGKGILLDLKKVLPDLIDDVEKNLKEISSSLEVAFNMTGGNGKIHMATLSALLRLGVGIRLVAATKDGVVQI